MSNDYFTQESWATRQTRARAATVNNLAAALVAAFDKLPPLAQLATIGDAYGTTTGAGNAYSVAVGGSFALTAGVTVSINVHATNTGAASLNVDSTGARAIKRTDGTDVEAGDLPAGAVVPLVYDGTNFIYLSVPPSHLAGLAGNLAADLVFSGDLTFGGSITHKQMRETVVALSGATPTVDTTEGTIFLLTTSGNTTFTFSTPAGPYGASFSLYVTAGGAHTLTWPAEVQWSGGVTPLAPADGETDLYTFLTRDAGSTWTGAHVGNALG